MSVGGTPEWARPVGGDGTLGLGDWLGQEQSTWRSLPQSVT